MQAGQKYDLVALLDKCLSSYFMERTYSTMVEEINIDLYCFQTPFRLKHHIRPRYHEDKTVKILPRDKKCDATFRMYHLLFVDIPLPDEFATCSEEEAVPMIGQTLVKYFTETPLPLKSGSLSTRIDSSQTCSCSFQTIITRNNEGHFAFCSRLQI